MVSLTAYELRRIVRAIRTYDAKSTIAKLGGLLTAPELQANTIRIETLVHLSAAHCQGRSHLGSNEIDEWLNNHLDKSRIAWLEDPVEDVFVTNVETTRGNRLIFQSVWESNDYFVQVVIDILDNPEAPWEYRRLLVPAFALLDLSDCVAKRVGLERWHSEPSKPGGTVKVPSATQIADRARAVTFTPGDLSELGVTREILEPFILRDKDKQALPSETIGNSSLERRPLVDFGGDLVLALPHAVSLAIRRFALTELRRLGYLSTFSKVLATRQARQIEWDCFRDLKGKTDSLTPPSPDGNIPSLHCWLLKYDINKFLHVILLHDRMDWLESQGFSSVMEYPDEQEANLGTYLTQVASHCRSLPDFSEGTTLLVFGGLGRGFTLGFDSYPDDWRLSCILISDLLMLASDIDRPIICYLKCIKQKNWAERKGVYFQPVNGDYNVYCYWRQQNYYLVPSELPLNPRSILTIASDFILPVRKEIRNLVDRHMLQTTDGSFVPVMRLGRGTYFKSMRDHPIYVSLAHLGEGKLAGAVETRRGPSWFLVKPRQGDENVQRFLYQMWDGFIFLYGKLVLEIESLYPNALADGIEIRLDFGDVIVSKNYEDLQIGETVGKPESEVNIKQCTAEVRFPPDFLRYFRQPENIGEKVVLRSIAEGIMSLYQETTENIGESALDTLVHRVIGHTGMRVLHVFHTHYPIERLLTAQDSDPMFLAPEDLNFFKLGLSEGCTFGYPKANIVSRTKCNIFLNRIVEKIWDRLRERLQQFDRVSVIRMGLKVHEVAIQDRDQWRRTAQAILAFWKRSDDVHAIARDRESERSRVSLAARTILEMAICECPSSGGQQLSQWALDELLAEAVLLIQVAMDSDAIHGDLTKARVELHANGDYAIDRSFYETIINPFITAHHSKEFEEAAGKYSELYRKRPPGARRRVDQIFSPQFISVFQIEFGLTPDDAVDGFAELMDLAVERDSTVVETTLGNIRARLTTRRDLTSSACEAFIRTFTIFHRPEWDKPPPGFKLKDLYPWRFRRRLSATARPILAYGEQDDDKVLFGAGALKLGVWYLLERTERGHLPQDFFNSHEMKQYIGAVNNERGHAFARLVADDLRKNGWQAKNEVQMTELGAPSDLGDVDVLAWNPNEDIQLIECKRLQLARTVSEVAEVCRRFQGEVKDDLDKHVQRVKWIKAKPTCLQQIVGFVPDPARVDDRLVTNTHVPLTYLTSLPINADKIGPLA